MITIERVAVKDVMIQMAQMMQGYEAELPLPYKLNPDWEQYLTLDRLGKLILTVAKEDDRVIGFFAIVINANINCIGEQLAIGASLYLTPGYRGGKVGLQLIKHGEELAIKQGAKCILLSSQASKPIDAFLKRRGYHLSESIFARRP